MNLPDVVVVKADDWEGLYVDGVLKTEWHEVFVDQILAVYGLPPLKTVWADEKWLHEEGNLPERLEGVKRESE